MTILSGEISSILTMSLLVLTKTFMSPFKTYLKWIKHNICIQFGACHQSEHSGFGKKGKRINWVLTYEDYIDLGIYYLFRRSKNKFFLIKY